jgi:predicted nucleic acid-binding protein
MALGAKLGHAHELVTTTYFVMEAHKRLRQDARAPRAAATRLASDMRTGDMAQVVGPESFVNFAALLSAWEQAPALSLEDLAGAAVMRSMGIRDIWAWDDDFRRLGFRVVP